MELSAHEFIHRYLQHVLPKGFVKVRYYGLYAHAFRNKLKNIPVKRLKKTRDSRPDKKKPAEKRYCP